MTSELPPDPPYFSGIDFNPSFYVDESNSSGITQEQANTLYLQKTIPDTATALETFSGGIKVNTIETVNTADITNISTNSTGNIFIGTSASRTNANPIQIGTTASLIRFGSSTNSQITNNTLSMSNVQCLNLNSITSVSAFGLLGSHTGPINIGNIVSRTGDISIASNQTTGTGNINIGSTALTTGSQNITMNRPLTLNYGPDTQTSFTQLGFYKYFGGTQQTMPTNSSYVTFTETTSLPPGVYMLNYQLYSLISLTTTGDTIIENQMFGISTTTNGVYPAGCNQVVTENIVRPPGVTYSQAFTGVVQLTSSGILYLIGAFTFSTNCTLKITGGVGVVRIG